MLHLQTGIQKFKMAAAEPEVPLSHLLDKIAKKFQRLPPCFRGRRTQWRYRQVSILKPEVRNSRWRLAPVHTVRYRRRASDAWFDMKDHEHGSIRCRHQLFSSVYC